MFCNMKRKQIWVSLVLFVFMLFSVLNFSIPKNIMADPGTSDTTAPVWTDGVLDAAEISAEGLTLTWSGAGDDTAVTGYKVYQGDTVIAALDNVNTYNVSGLSAETAYSFTVQALDAAGNESTTGPSKNVTTTPLAAPQLAAPELAAPELAAPELAAPELTAPELTAPELTAPELTAPELTAPELTADTSDNTEGKAVDITFNDDADWRGAITGITIDGKELTIGQYTVSAGDINIAAGVMTMAGNHVINITASPYPDATVTQTMVASSTPPVLVADTTDNSAGRAIDITFPDASWRAAITGIAVDGNALIPSQYTVSAGDIKIAAGVITTAGDHAITVIASGYPDVNITQSILPLTSPPLTADTTDNTAGKAVDITFTDDSNWRTAITGVAVDGTALTAGQFTKSTGKITIAAGVITTSGDHTITVTASLYPDATVTQTMVAALTPPQLTADSTGNTIGQAIDITFTDDVAWRGAIAGVKVNGTSLPSSQYTVNSGDIGIAAVVLNTNSNTIVVSAVGYSDDSVTQAMNVIDKNNLPYGYITTVAGNGNNGFSGDNQPAASARFSLPRGTAVDSAGNIYIADTGNSRIRKVDTNGIVTTIAGTGVQGYSGDGGPATSAKIMPPIDVAVDSAGNLYIADSNNNCIRKVDTAGIITTVAGPGVAGTLGDGNAATSAYLKTPYGVTVDNAGNIYIADYGNYRVREVAATDHTQYGIIMTAGNIYTVAGTGTSGYAGDNGAATSAMIRPYDVAVDNAGNIYIADYTNYRIRKVDSSGIITTVAGTGTSGYSGDGGLASNANTGTVASVATDNAGNLYLLDQSNNRVRKVDTSGIITTIAGNGTANYAGDGGPGTSASIKTSSNLGGLAVDMAGNLYIADAGNNRIRYVNLPLSTSVLKSLVLSGSPNLNYAGVPITYDLNSLTLTSSDQSGSAYIVGSNAINWKVVSGPAIICNSTLTITASGAVTVSASVNGLVSNSLIVTAQQIPPILAANSTANFVNLPINITFTDDAYWRAAITGITVDGNPLNTSQYSASTAGNITFPIGVLAAAGDHSIVIKAQGYADDSLTQTILGVSTPPQLTADISNNFSGAAIDVTFTDEVFQKAITGVSVDGNALTADKYTVSDGDINIAGSVFAAAKSYTIAVKATGYSDASVVQNVTGAVANFAGSNTVTEWDVNSNGLTMTIGLPNGYSFADNISDYKDEIIDGLTFYGTAFDKNELKYYPVPWNAHITGANMPKGGASGTDTLYGYLNGYSSSGYYTLLDTVNNISVYDRYVGLNPPGASSLLTASTVNAGEQAAYPGVKQGIINALKAGASVSVNSNGQLVIRCSPDAANGYFSSFSDDLPVVNGGIQIVSGDVLLSATLPAGVIKEYNGPVAIGNYFTIEEMKMHPEVWEYVDASHANDPGVFAITTRINGADRNTSSSYPYKDADGNFVTYYVKQVPGNVLTDTDIRNGGVMGPNGTGNKLIKICIDDRVGPSQWASVKNASTFFTNLFRTSINATGYVGWTPNPITACYTPADDPQWWKVESQIVGGGLDPNAPYNVCTNKYVINYSGDDRGNTANPGKMWLFYEMPKTPDFNIASDMPVYENLIAGFFGGSGQSTPQNGQPILGMDGRYSFMIQVETPTVALASYNAILAAVKQADYTADSWAQYQVVVTANTVTAANTVTEIDAATNTIAAAQANLAFAGRANLDTALAAAGALNQADYTVLSWIPLTTALALPEISNAAVTTKTKAINDAIAGLVLVGTTPFGGEILDDSMPADSIARWFGSSTSSAYSGDNGPAINATINPYSGGIAFDSEGDFCYADNNSNAVRMVAKSNSTRYGIAMKAGYIYTIAGNGTTLCPNGFSGIPAAQVGIRPLDIAFDKADNLYISTLSTCRIFKVDTSGNLITIAGNGNSGYTGDNGPAGNAQVGYGHLTVDNNGNIYYSDMGQNVIREIAATDHTQYGMVMTAGNIYTVAGTGTSGYSGDNGPAISAKLNYPQFICFDSKGNLYIAEANNSCVRKVDGNGIITTVAGNPTSTGYSGDNGPAAAAKLGGNGGVSGIAIDSNDNLYISDSTNACIRRVDTKGIITTAIDKNTALYGTLDLPLATHFYPSGIKFDSTDNLFIDDNYGPWILYVKGQPSDAAKDLTAYNAALAAAVEADYTSASWTAYQKVAAANTVTTANTQAEIDRATALIRAVQANLIFAGQGALDAAKAAVAAKAEVDYTADSWVVLTNALALPETTNTEVTAKAGVIDSARANLIFAGQAALDAAKAAAAAKAEVDYTADSWVVLTNALALPETTNTEVTAKAGAINSAQANLLLTGQAALDAAKAAAAAKAEADYTADSWVVLTNALALPETTNTEVTAKAGAIDSAQANLIFAGQADLDAAKTAAAAKVEADYTADSWVVLTNALALPETTNAEITAKTTAIDSAVTGLVKTPAISGGGGGGGGATPVTPVPPAVNQPGTGATVISEQSIDKQVTTTPDGKTTETFSVKEEVKTEIAKAISEGKDSIEITVAPSAQADKTVIDISGSIMQSSSGLGISIATTNVTLQLPKTLVDSLAKAGQDLSITVAKGTAAECASQMAGVQGTEGASVLGTPTVIHTEIKGNTTVTLPLTGITIPTDPVAQADFLKNLAIFAVHSDGGKQIIPASIVKDANGNPIAISFSVDKFSTFAIIQLAAPVSGLNDINNHWAQNYINTLVKLGVMGGYPDNSFKPDNSITRAEFATILVKAYKLPVASGKVFDDTAMHWGRDYIATAYAAGIINGYSSSSFGPDDPITREQMAVMIAKAAKINMTSTENSFTDRSEVSPWAADSVNAVAQAGIMKGCPDGTFEPQGMATRAEAAVVIVNALK